MPAVGGEGDAHAAAPVLAGGDGPGLRLVRDEREPGPPLRVHDGDAFGGGDPGAAVLTDDEAVGGGTDLDRADGLAAPARTVAPGVDEGHGVAAEVGYEEGAAGGAGGALGGGG
ncbi:hypothetical protein SMICM17S_01295 [Streptomyces microflavus]